MKKALLSVAALCMPLPASAEAFHGIPAKAQSAMSAETAANSKANAPMSVPIGIFCARLRHVRCCRFVGNSLYVLDVAKAIPGYPIMYRVGVNCVRSVFYDAPIPDKKYPAFCYLNIDRSYIAGSNKIVCTTLCFFNNSCRFIAKLFLCCSAHRICVTNSALGTKHILTPIKGGVMIIDLFLHKIFHITTLEATSQIR